MSSETIFVDCPHCGMRLEVDKQTGKVVKTWEKLKIKDGADPFAESLKKMKEEKDRLDKYFTGAPESLKQRRQELADKFEAEKQKIKDAGGTVERPLNPLDLD
ncbi:MAG: hypothetical protein PHP45_01600 [Elusimicrobiales bacterium]|nr:hypothetical protein [Elusimicrobiales bacterium]